MMDPKTAVYTAGHNNSAFRHADQRADVRFGDTSHEKVPSVAERVDAFFGPAETCDDNCSCRN